MSPIRLIAVLSLCACGLAQLPKKALPGDTIYFLRDNSQHQWCAYSSKEVWTSHIQQTDGDKMGYILYADRRLSQINVRTQDSTGDWLLDEKYDVDRQRELIRMNRVVFYFSENERKEELFNIRSGRATLVSSSASNLKTGERLPLPRPMDAFVSWPVITSLKDFPFAVIIEKLGDIGKSGSLCVSDLSQN